MPRQLHLSVQLSGTGHPAAAHRTDPARVVPLTSRTGLFPTVTTTHTEPFHTATATATAHA
ncbi:hypothetical protein ABZZ80_30250 [Streptomyces sp. NPDC006356]